MELLLLHHGFSDLLFFFSFFLHTYMHNTIQYTQLVLDSYPFSSLYKILSTSLDVCNNNNHIQTPPLLIRSTNQKRAQMRKPFKERQQFWWLFFFFGFPSTHYQSRQSWFKMQEQLGCFNLHSCLPRSHSASVPGRTRRVPELGDERRPGRPRAMKPRGARNSR